MTADINESAIVGAALTDPEITAAVHLPAADFADPMLGAAWEAATALHLAGKRPDPVLIAEHAKPIRVDPQRLVECVGAGVSMNAGYYAEQISAAARVRRFSDLLTGAQQKLGEGWGIDEIRGVLNSDSASSEQDQVAASTETLDEFVDTPLPPEQWIVPGLMTVDDRCIVTGTEGGGKSILLRQIAVMVAGGVHPFTYERVPPRRVMYVDCENPRRILQAKFGDLRDSMKERGTPVGAANMMIVTRPAGMDLRRMSDQMWLHQLCRLNQPELLVLGPVYRMCQKGPGENDEDLANHFIRAVDKLRGEFPMAVMMEHHPKHADTGRQREMRPFGSSVWMRWPEFGIGLRPAADAPRGVRLVDVVHFRGARDERGWPVQLEGGTVFPWVDANPMDHRRAS